MWKPVRVVRDRAAAFVAWWGSLSTAWQIATVLGGWFGSTTIGTALALFLLDAMDVVATRWELAVFTVLAGLGVGTVLAIVVVAVGVWGTRVLERAAREPQVGRAPVLSVEEQVAVIRALSPYSQRHLLKLIDGPNHLRDVDARPLVVSGVVERVMHDQGGSVYRIGPERMAVVERAFSDQG